VENARIEFWLSAIREAAKSDQDVALELAQSQNLIKGYGETHARGLRKLDAVMRASKRLQGTPDAAQALRKLRLTALQDHDEAALNNAL
jgi:indolepyruvate ferredoxin oxidoreductase beta subunit